MSRRVRLFIVIAIELIIAIFAIMFLIQDQEAKSQSAVEGGSVQILTEAAECKLLTSTSQMESAQQIIQERLIGLGVVKSIVQQQDDCHLVITLPPEIDPKGVTDIVLRGGLLEFVDAGQDSFPDGTLIRTSGNPTPTLPTASLQMTVPTKIYSAVVTGADFEPSRLAVQLNSTTQELSVSFTLKTEAAKLFAEFTGLHNETTLGQRYYICIVLDNVVQTCPSIRTPITGGSGVIAIGQGGLDEANRLVNLLRYGALPVHLSVVQINTVTTSAAEDVRRPAIIFGIIGFIAVVVLTVLIFEHTAPVDEFEMDDNSNADVDDNPPL